MRRWHSHVDLQCVACTSMRNTVVALLSQSGPSACMKSSTVGTTAACRQLISGMSASCAADTPERPGGLAAASDTTVNPLLGSSAPSIPLAGSQPTQQPQAAPSDAAPTSSNLLSDSPLASQTAPPSSSQTALPSQHANDSSGGAQSGDRQAQAEAAAPAEAQIEPWPSVAQLEAEGVDQMLQVGLLTLALHIHRYCDRYRDLATVTQDPALSV